MERATAQNGIAALLRSDATLMALLPGEVWTRKIRRNDNPPEIGPTPGSTPEAFDSAGRIRRCVSILNGDEASNPLGPDGAYYGFPEVWLRCLPHESEKAKLHEAEERIIMRLKGAVLAGMAGEGLCLRVAGRMGLDDDPVITPAVVSMIRVQVDSMWGV